MEKEGKAVYLRKHVKMVDITKILKKARSQIGPSDHSPPRDLSLTKTAIGLRGIQFLDAKLSPAVLQDEKLNFGGEADAMVPELDETVQ